MSVITRVPEPNIWDEICKEFEAQCPPFDEDDTASIKTDYEDFDPAKHHPAFFGKMFSMVGTDFEVMEEIDPAISHPACVGYAFTDKPPLSPVPQPPTPPPKEKCSPTEYLEAYVFPTLLPALAAMLERAKVEKCFERKRTKFSGVDFLCEYLYRHNKKYEGTGREEVDLWDIPFVVEWLRDHPRPPLPLSLVWTEEEAALIIQSHWRGYLVRRDEEVQELRAWQREWREENRGIQNRVSDFWDKKMPDWDKPTPNLSDEKVPSSPPRPVQSPTASGGPVPSTPQ